MGHPALRVALPLLVLTLAGCLSQPAPGPGGPAAAADIGALSEKRFDVLPPEEVWVPSSVDGKRLHHAVYRPATDARVPVWVNFSPYWGDGAMEQGDNFAQYMINEYVPRGYAVVLSAVRGTGHSEGCFQISGDLELQDAWDVIEHFADEPWSTGSVGAGGKSYDSTTQNGVLAKVPHPALKTTFHVSGITDFYRYNYRYGVPYGFGAAFNTYYYLAEGLDEYGDFGFFGTPTALPDTDESPESLARLLDDAACPEFARMTASGFGTGAHGLRDAYWVERDWNRFIGNSSTGTSIFFVHGLQDWNVKPDHILPWLQNLPPGVVVKGWLHQWTREPEGGHVYPMRTDWNLTMLRWMDHWLKGVDTGILGEPAFEAQGDDGVWRASAAWPPVGAVRSLPLADLPSLGEGTRVAGAPTLTVRATSAHADPVLTAVLWRETPGGERAWVNEAVLRGAYRAGLEEPQPVQPGQALDYVLEFYPMDAVLGPGQRWVVELGAEPRHAQPQAAQLAGVAYDEGSAAITLPLAPLDGALPIQPEAVDCFAC